MSSSSQGRSKQVRKIRVDVQRSREKQPWEVDSAQSLAAQRYFPGNENWQTDNSAGTSVVKALPASNLIRETLAPPTIDAWPRKQNKISSLSQKPSDAESIPPLMKKLNKLVWEGLRSVGLLVDRCIDEYEHDNTAHEIDCENSKAGTFSELSTSRLVLEVVHRFMENVALLEDRMREDCESVLVHTNSNSVSGHATSRPPSSPYQQQHHQQPKSVLVRPGSAISQATSHASSANQFQPHPHHAVASPFTIEEQKKLALELVEDNKRVKKVLKNLCYAVARWSIFEQAGDIFSKCFATYEAAITEVMKECADCVDDVLNTLVSEISILRTKLAAAKREVRNHMEERNKFIAEKEEYRKQAEQALKEKQEALANFAAKDRELKILKFDLEDRDKTIAKMNEENDLLSKQFTAQENKINRLSSQIAKANEKIESLNIHVAELKRNLAQSETVASNSAVETLALRQQLASAKSATSNLKSDMSKLQSDRNFLRQQLDQISSLSPTNLQKNLGTTGTGGGGNNSADPSSTIMLQKSATGNFAANDVTGVLASGGFVVPYFDINEWIETSARTYVQEIDKRLDSAFYGESPFFDLRQLLLKEASMNLSPQPSFVPPTNGSITANALQQQASIKASGDQQAGNASNNNNTTGHSEANHHHHHHGAHHPDIKSRNTTAIQIVSIADQMSRPFFVGMGDDTTVPPALRYIGKISNYHFGVETLQNLIIAFFRDTSENFPKHVLADTLDYSHQIAFATISKENNNNRSRRPTIFGESTTANLMPENSMTEQQSMVITRQQSMAAIDPAVAMTTSHQKSLLHLLNHWIAFHLDCEDATPPLYNILYAARWHSYSTVCRFFDAAIRFDAPAALWFAISDAILMFKRTLESSVPDVFSISEASVQETLKKTFSTSLPSAALTRISIVIHQFFQDYITQQEQQQGSSPSSRAVSHEVSLRSVFSSGTELAKRKHRRLLISRQTKEDTSSPVVWAADSVDESPIVREIRNECLQSWFELINELSESIIDRAIISPDGHVTPYSIADAILHVDPIRPKSSMDKIMATLFGTETIDPAEAQQQQQGEKVVMGHSDNNEASAGSEMREGSLMSASSAAAPPSGLPRPESSGIGQHSEMNASMFSVASGKIQHATAKDEPQPRDISEFTPLEQSTRLQTLLEGELLSKDSENRDDDGNVTYQKNYSELYRRKKYARGELLLVHDALSRLKMVPLARYTPPAEENQ